MYNYTARVILRVVAVRDKIARVARNAEQTYGFYLRSAARDVERSVFVESGVERIYFEIGLRVGRSYGVYGMMPAVERADKGILASAYRRNCSTLDRHVVAEPEITLRSAVVHLGVKVEITEIL